MATTATGNADTGTFKRKVREAKYTLLPDPKYGGQPGDGEDGAAHVGLDRHRTGG